ncbi:iron ABC transporter substrate-binding protein [Pseudonocardia yunnanensis]|uniref:Iron ABC transporter substrate-binding protein n=1 Tax=Pseudonocardia yunnanensis TaxID=58107 RepID=A0ABW4EWP3_9PSEU
MDRRPLLARGSSIGAAGAAVIALLAGCAGPEQAGLPGGGGSAPTLTIYSGRSEELVAPLIPQLESAVGRDVEIRYGSTDALETQVMQEGPDSPADVFLGQDGGALGTLSRAGLLAPLPADVVAPVPERYRAPDLTWVATSARARVVAYNPGRVAATDLPSGLDDLLAPRWSGRLGFAPTNASWLSFVTGVRLVRGEEGARQWLTAFAAQHPRRFDGNGEIVEAVAEGTIDAGLVNHYYLYRKTERLDPATYPVRNHYVPDDPLGLVNVAGAAVLASSDDQEAARRAVAFLLSRPAQQHVVDETGEYPVLAGVTPSRPYDLAPLESLSPPVLDLSDLGSLERSETMLQEVGLL